MKNLILLITLLFALQSYSQNINGQWEWSSSNGENTFLIDISSFNGTQIKATHCASFYSGKKIDCNYDSENCSIILNKVSTNKFEGTIQSGFSGSTGKIRLTYLPNTNNFHYELLIPPTSEYYLPKNITLKR